MITEQELKIASRCLGYATAAGASAARIVLSKSVMDLVSTLDGEIDKVTHCLDRSLTVSLIVDGRFGSFSSNNLDDEYMQAFIEKSCRMVRMLAPDPCRKLPARDRICTNAIDGREMGNYDSNYGSSSPQDRNNKALSLSLHNSGADLMGKGWKLISEEGEYSECEDDSVTLDSEGLYCRQTETTFDYSVELTIQETGRGGDRYTAFWWESSPFADKLEAESCGKNALKRAISEMNPQECPSGKYRMVVDRDVASTLVKPILNALNGYSIQQHNSFLIDSIGQRKFSPGLTIVDMPFRKGETGSKLFDSEGVATREDSIISHGKVEHYFINTYMSGKLGMEPTTEDPVRPAMPGWPREGLNRGDIMNLCGQGILVTEFNGGNSSAATGDFSFGVEGYAFRNGVITHPVSGLLITGNMLDLWNNLIAVGSDARTCMSKLIPTLAFENVDFSG